MKKLEIIDVEELVEFTLQKDPLPREFGQRLDTVEKARRWLTNPFNWHDSNIYILKWDGIVPTVSRTHGLRLATETWDDGLPIVVVKEQFRLRSGGKSEEKEEGKT